MTTPLLQKHQFVYFLFGLGIYRHPCISSKYQSGPRRSYRNTSLFLSGRLQDLSTPLYQLEILVTTTPFLQKPQLVSYLDGLRTYQHPCISSKYLSRPRHSYRNTSLFVSWSALGLISTPALARNISHDHAIPTETLACFLPGRFQALSVSLYQFELLVTSTSFLQKDQLVYFPVVLGTYQHPCIGSYYQSRPRHSYRNTSLCPSWSVLGLISIPVLVRYISHDHAIPTGTQLVSLLVGLRIYQHPCIRSKY